MLHLTESDTASTPDEFLDYLWLPVSEQLAPEVAAVLAYEHGQDYHDWEARRGLALSERVN